MSKQGLLALATGLAGGYAAGKQRLDEKERRDRLDAQNTELHNARMDELNAGRQQRIALADAVAPRTAQEGAVVDGGQGREFYKDPAQAGAVQEDRQIEAEMRAEQAGQAPVTLAAPTKGYGMSAGSKSKISTEKPDLDAENSTDAKLKRQIEVIQTTDPAKAITLANAALEQKERFQKAADDAAYRKINSFQTPDELAAFMTEYPHDGLGGKFKAKVVPSADGKTWSFIGTDADGKEVKIPGDYTNDDDGMTKARMMLAGRFSDPNRRLEFYKWDQEMGRKKGANAETARHNAVMEDAATRRAKAAEKAAGGGTGSNNLSREERLRYTSLFTDAGRRLGEANKTLAELQKRELFKIRAKEEGTPEAQQMAYLQESINKYTQERDLYQGMLAESQSKPGAKGGAKPQPAAAPAAPASAEPTRVTTAAERDALPKGARYIAPDGQLYIKQ